MHYSAATAVGLLAAVAYAADHEVTVGPGFEFKPSSIKANEGDTVSFKIGTTHNVVQGDFDSPCRYKSGGIYSGEPYSGSDFNSQYFVVQINSTDPIYAFCSEPGHCQGGMVFGINVPSSGDTLSSYKDSASSAGSSEGGNSVTGGFYSDSKGASSSGSSSASSASAGSSSAQSTAASSSGAATSSGSSSSGSTSASTTSAGAASATTPAASSSTSPGAAAGVEANQGAAAFAVLALAGVMSWFM